MKNLGPLLAGGLTLLIVLAVGVFSFLPAQPAPAAESATGPIVVPAADTGQLEAAMAERENVYQGQLQQLEQTYQDRQAMYQSQIQTLNSQITAAQNQLDDLTAQEATLSLQVAQFEQSRTERLNTYQAQLNELNPQYADRLSQLQAQINEAQAKLAEVNAQLGQ